MLILALHQTEEAMTKQDYTEHDSDAELMSMDEALRLIDNYCYDEPAHGAAERLMRYNSGEFDGVNEPGSWELQNRLDAILYTDGYDVISTIPHCDCCSYHGLDRIDAAWRTDSGCYCDECAENIRGDDIRDADTLRPIS